MFTREAGRGWSLLHILRLVWGKLCYQEVARGYSRNLNPWITSCIYLMDI